MDINTLSEAAIATFSLIGPKACEKIGLKLGENIFEQGGKLLRQKLEQKFPQVLKTIKAVEENREGLDKAMEEVETAAKSDSEVKEAVETVATAIKAESQNITNIEKNMGVGGSGNVVTGKLLISIDWSRPNGNGQS